MWGGVAWGGGVEDCVFGGGEEVEDGGKEGIYLITRLGGKVWGGGRNHTVLGHLGPPSVACWQGWEVEVQDPWSGFVCDGEGSSCRCCGSISAPDCLKRRDYRRTYSSHPPSRARHHMRAAVSH